MRILVTGSRDWDDEGTIRLALAQITMLHGHEHVVVHGGARGADTIAGAVADAWTGGMTTETHPADWNQYGKRAGFVRNAEMVNAGADVCLAFIRNNSRGATMCAQLAEKAGIPVRYYRLDD